MHTKHGNCQILETKVGEETSQVQLCKGLKLIDSLHLRTLTQMGSICSYLLYRAGRHKETWIEYSASKINQVRAPFPKVTLLTTEFVELPFFAFFCSFRVSEDFFFISWRAFLYSKRKQNIESFYHFAPQKIFLERPLPSSQKAYTMTNNTQLYRNTMITPWWHFRAEVREMGKTTKCAMVFPYSFIPALRKDVIWEHFTKNEKFATQNSPLKHQEIFSMLFTSPRPQRTHVVIWCWPDVTIQERGPQTTAQGEDPAALLSH